MQLLATPNVLLSLNAEQRMQSSLLCVSSEGAPLLQLGSTVTVRMECRNQLPQDTGTVGYHSLPTSRAPRYLIFRNDIGLPFRDVLREIVLSGYDMRL